MGAAKINQSAMREKSDELIPTRWSLIGRLKHWDDHQSWREFFDTYWRLIYAVALKSGLTDAEAQDVVQETVISVSKNMKSFKADPAFGSFKSWLLNLTRWRITDQMRKRGREVLPASDGTSDSTGGSPGTRFEDRVPDLSGNQLDRIWEEEWEKHLIDAALEKVKLQCTAKHYQVFYLQAIKQVPPAKVAETLAINVDQVYLIKHRLTKIFEEALKAAGTATG
jgi:RNA polymerase sigma factor (sigma-70 family)